MVKYILKGYYNLSGKSIKYCFLNMRINICVKTNSKKEKVEKKEDGSFLVCICERPVKGKANKKIIEVLADYFNVGKADVFILKGEKNKNKVVEIVN